MSASNISKKPKRPRSHVMLEGEGFYGIVLGPTVVRRYVGHSGTDPAFYFFMIWIVATSDKKPNDTVFLVRSASLDLSIGRRSNAVYQFNDT